MSPRRPNAPLNSSKRPFKPSCRARFGRWGRNRIPAGAAWPRSPPRMPKRNRPADTLPAPATRRASGGRVPGSAAVIPGRLLRHGRQWRRVEHDIRAVRGGPAVPVGRAALRQTQPRPNRRRNRGRPTRDSHRPSVQPHPRRRAGRPIWRAQDGGRSGGARKAGQAGSALGRSAGIVVQRATVEHGVAVDRSFWDRALAHVPVLDDPAVFEPEDIHHRTGVRSPIVASVLLVEGVV